MHPEERAGGDESNSGRVIIVDGAASVQNLAAIDAGGEAAGLGTSTTSSDTVHSSEPPDRRGVKRPRIVQQGKRVVGKAAPKMCKVQDCEQECRGPKSIRCKVCYFHMHAAELNIDGVLKRFCFKCSKFHMLTEFKAKGHTCTAWLERLRMDYHREKQKKERLNNRSSLPSSNQMESSLKKGHEGVSTTATASGTMTHLSGAHAEHNAATQGVSSVPNLSAHLPRAGNWRQTLDTTTLGMNWLSGGQVGDGYTPPMAPHRPLLQVSVQPGLRQAFDALLERDSARLITFPGSNLRQAPVTQPLIPPMSLDSHVSDIENALRIHQMICMRHRNIQEQMFYERSAGSAQSQQVPLSEAGRQPEASRRAGSQDEPSDGGGQRTTSSIKPNRHSSA